MAQPGNLTGSGVILLFLEGSPCSHPERALKVRGLGVLYKRLIAEDQAGRSGGAQKKSSENPTAACTCFMYGTAVLFFKQDPI